MGFSVGEDLFSVLAIVGLVAVFITVLAHSYHVHAERQNAFKDFNLALDVTELIKDRVLAVEGGSPGLLELSQGRLENYSRRLALQGVNLRAEIRTLAGELLFSYGPEPDPLGQCLSPPASLPVVALDQGSAKPSLLSVQVWRG